MASDLEAPPKMASLCLCGPDVMVIGWVPFFPSLAAMPAGHKYQQSFASRLLFSSGNPTPPANFADYNDFAGRYFPLSRGGSKEYRAILYLRNVKLFYVDHDPI